MKRKPNLILVISDTLRADYLGCYGNDKIHTPNLDNFAEESTVFDCAYPEVLPTIPARRSIHTGRRIFPCYDYYVPRWCPIRLPGWQPMSNDEDTLAEDLVENGYYTGFLTDTDAYFFPGMNFTRGFLQWEFIRGYGEYYNSPAKVPPEILFKYGGDTKKMKQVFPKYDLLHCIANLLDIHSEEDTTVAKLFQRAMRFIEENQTFQPFYLLIDTFVPHEPWQAPDSYLKMYGDPKYAGRVILHPEYRSVDGQMNQKEFQHLKAHYSGLVSLLDSWFGYFIEKLKRLGSWENSVIAFLSDHGTNFADNPKGIIGKPHYALYPGVMHVPLIVHFPDNVGKDKRFNQLVYNVDVTATLYHCAGLQKDNIDGQSLYSLVKEGKWSERDYLTCRYGDSVWYRDRKYWIIMDIKGNLLEAFDLEKDPKCQKNIALEEDIIKRVWQLILKDAKGKLPDYSQMIKYTDAIGRKVKQK